MPSPITTRPATRRDLEILGDLWIELMTVHRAVDARFRIPPQGRAHYIRHLARAIADRQFLVMVAENATGIIGYVLAYIASNPPIFAEPYYGFIADLCVTSHARRQGAGRRLVEAVTQWFRQHDLQNFQLNVAHHNPESQAFWRGIGCTDYLDHMWMSLDH